MGRGLRGLLALVVAAWVVVGLLAPGFLMKLGGMGALNHAAALGVALPVFFLGLGLWTLAGS